MGTSRQAKYDVGNQPPALPSSIWPQSAGKVGENSSHTNAQVGLALVGATQPDIRASMNIAHTSIGSTNAATTQTAPTPVLLFIFQSYFTKKKLIRQHSHIPQLKGRDPRIFSSL